MKEETKCYIYYVLCMVLLVFLMQGCDLGMSSNDTIDTGANEACDYGDLGTVPWNPVYVKIVE